MTTSGHQSGQQMAIGDNFQLMIDANQLAAGMLFRYYDIFTVMVALPGQVLVLSPVTAQHA